MDVLLADNSLNQRIERLQMLTKREVSIDGKPMEHAINRGVEDYLVGSLTDLLERRRNAQRMRTADVHETWETDPEDMIRRRPTRRMRMD